MNPPVLDPIGRAAALRGRTPPAGRAAAVRPAAPSRRRLRARLRAWLLRPPPARALAPPAGAPPAPIDARELSSWAPFSPRF